MRETSYIRFFQKNSYPILKPMNNTFTAKSSRQSATEFLKFPLILNSSCWLNPCDTNKQDPKLKMIFVVKSAVVNFRAREVLRRTWAGVSYLEGIQFASIFVIGKTDIKTQALVDEEYARYGDILQVNMTDDYNFIAKKTLSGMRWMFENFPDDVYYTSCDDDFMIDIAGLVDVMKSQENNTEMTQGNDFPIICSYMAKFGDIPARDNRSKYYTSKEEYKWPYWPDFCLGGAYTTNVGVVRQLWNASKKIKPLKMDDVWITGVLREKIGMPRQYIRQLNKSVASHYGGLNKKKNKTNRKKMLEEWNSLQKKFENLTKCSC